MMDKSMKYLRREFYVSVILLMIFYIGIPLSSIKSLYLLLMVLTYGLTTIYLIIVCGVGLFYGFYSLYKKEKPVSKNIWVIFGHMVFIFASIFAMNGFFILKNIFSI